MSHRDKLGIDAGAVASERERKPWRAARQTFRTLGGGMARACQWASVMSVNRVSGGKSFNHSFREKKRIIQSTKLIVEVSGIRKMCPTNNIAEKALAEQELMMSMKITRAKVISTSRHRNAAGRSAIARCGKIK